MTESEARKEIIESGIKLGAGDYVDIKALEVAVKALEEVQAYRAIGTIERFRELTEKAEPKKPIIDDSGHEVYKLCPTCRAHLIGTICCGRCGQRIG